MLLSVKRVKVNHQISFLVFCFIALLAIVVFNFLYFENTTSLMSQFRFLWGLAVLLIFLLYFSDEHRSIILLDYYLKFVVFSSFFIILQNLSYHVLGFHFFLSFGTFDLIRVSTDGAIPGVHTYIRSGGVFREPSWFAIFVMPSLFMLHKLVKLKQLAIVLVALIMSTSSLGYVFILLFVGVLVAFSNNLKLKIVVVLLSILSLILLYLVYIKFEFLFERLIFVMETGGSASIRLIDPLRYFADNITFFGTDTSFMKNDDEVFFVNTLLYIFFSFGCIGLMLCLPVFFSYKLKYLYYSLGVFTSILIEGLSGRIDFWILLLILLLVRANRLGFVNSYYIKSPLC